MALDAPQSAPETTSGQQRPGETMGEEQLLALIRMYELASLGSQVAAGATISTTVYPSNQAMTTLEIDRYNALNMYFARPLGNEVENRSQVVLPELRDTIEWIIPQLMRMFTGAKTVCRFDAENEGDEKQAELETLIVNHIFMQENNGFFILQDFFKDAMLMRNGYAMVYWREERIVTIDRYRGLLDIELASVLEEEEGETKEVIEQDEKTVEIALPLAQAMPGQPQPPAAPPIKLSTFDISVRTTKTKKGICVECLPPEEMRVTPRATGNMENVGFAMHMTTEARSDLIAQGFDKDKVNSCPAGRPNWLDIDALARNQTVDQLSIENPSDHAMEEIEVRLVVMRVDYDGDGIAELRRILIASNTILENEIIEETPFASCVPKRMPHRHTGVSLYDEIADIQIIKTTLWRQGLDNLSISNNQRVAIDWRKANVDDLLTSRPGGVVRGDGPPSQWIEAIQQPSNLVEQVLPALGYLDEQKTTRTGIGKGTMAIDPDELQNVTKGAQLAAMNAAALKVEMLARLLAEGVKDIFRKIHSELIRNQDKPMQFEIAGKWMTVDPSKWKRRSKLTVNVGLGSGNREEMRTNVQMLAQLQIPLGQLGMVGPKQAYETFKLGCEALGFSTPERFAMDPASAEFQQHMQQMQAAQAQAGAPAIQVAKIKAQSAQQIEQMRLQGDQAKLAADQAKDQAEIEHAALSTHSDRQMAQEGNRHEMAMTLVKVLGQIIAQELKGQREDAGAELDRAFESARALEGE